MAYWLMRSEPDVYGWDHLAKDGATEWDGVRNYQARNNNELVATWGNLANRVLSFCYKNWEGYVPDVDVSTLRPADLDLLAVIAEYRALRATVIRLLRLALLAGKLMGLVLVSFMSILLLSNIITALSSFSSSAINDFMWAR